VQECWVGNFIPTFKKTTVAVRDDAVTVTKDVAWKFQPSTCLAMSFSNCELPIGTTAYSGLLYEALHGLGTANGY
jgi:hypothetical protein